MNMSNMVRFLRFYHVAFYGLFLSLWQISGDVNACKGKCVIKRNIQSEKFLFLCMYLCNKT